MMNCKPGDLAVIVRSWAGNEGKVVTCIRLDERASSVLTYDSDGNAYLPEPTWVTDRELPDCFGNLSTEVLDSQLHPIRDPGEDAQDETLSWLPVPEKEGVTA